MFFDTWATIWRTVIVGVLGYLAIVIFVRTSGKRTLSKLNAFDLVVTVALGSTLATILLSKDVALAEGITAFAVLVGMQYVVAWLSVRSGAVRKITRSEPRLLVHKGAFLSDAMLDERVTETEVLSAIRNQGFPDMSEIHAVVLETDGSFSVIKEASGAPRALRTVRGFPHSA